MTFTEIAFELGDPRHPLCRATRAPQVHAVVRILDTGELSRRHRAHLAFHGTPEAATELVRELRALRPDAHVDTLSQSPTETGLYLEAPVEAVGLGAIAPTLLAHGMTAVFDPLVAREGRLRIRATIPRVVEPPHALRALQDVQRACGFADFRIQRIAAVDASAHIESARRALAPDQEALLALAASMGYYETPKSVTLDEIARSVGLSISPVHKRLKSAEETLVAHHVGQAPVGGPRRRPRASAARIDGNTPWEIQVRVRGDVGPLHALEATPQARASLHPLSSDSARGQVSLLVVQASADAQARLLEGIEGRPEVAEVAVLDRSSEHAACRLATRDRGPYALGWFHEAWGSEASLRAIAFEGGAAHLRAILLRPQTGERIQQRLAECARVAGWEDWSLVSSRPLLGGTPPPRWPEPLTQRQLEVLRVAHALGYYKTPRVCTLEHVAGTLGVSANAVHKNLVLAESKLISAYLASGQ